MKAKNLCVYAGLCAGVASMATGQVQRSGKLELVSASQKLEPTRIAKVAMRDGQIVFQSDWMPYTGGNSRATNVQIFDCFGDENADGAPDDGICGLGGSRYTLGSAFCNMYYTNDMVVADNTVIDDGAQRIDFGWFWTAGGLNTSEYCVIAVFTQESEPCDADTQDYGGWLLDFGTLQTGVRTGGNVYYITNVDITPGAWTLPSDGAGSYFMFFLQDATSQQWTFATCAQPALWATGNDGGNPNNIGTQTVLQLDDTTFVDGTHTSSECFSYSFTSVCPSILGGMAQFWGNTSDGGGCSGIFPDCDQNGTVNTQDFLCFLGKWSAAFQSGNYDAAADCNGDNVINTQDFLCFLGKFAACFG